MSDCCCCCFTCVLAMAANVDWTVVRAVQAGATGPHRSMFNDGCFFQRPTGYTMYVDRSYCDERDREIGRAELMREIRIAEMKRR